MIKKTIALHQNTLRRALPWLGALVICAALLVMYQPSLSIGFYADDYEFVEPAGRLGWGEYLDNYFNPLVQWHWYRPFQGLAWRIGYVLFARDMQGYHALQLLFHMINCLLLYALVARIAGRWSLALLATLIYAGLPTADLAVLFTAVADPLVVVFYLATMWLWLEYCTHGGRARYIISLLALTCALMSKETAAVLPAVMFLVDRWIVGKPQSLRQMIGRYALPVLIMGVYGLFQVRVLTKGVFTTYLGYGVGGHIFASLASHLSKLAFPWGLPEPLSWIWLAVVLAGVAVVFWRRQMRLAFLVAATVLPVLPILPFPAAIAQATRYLYLPLMGSAVALALVVDRAAAWVHGRPGRWVSAGLIAVALGVMIWGGTVIAQDSENFAGFTRQTRLAFRPLFQRYPSVAQGTVLYFLDKWYENLSGTMFVRYGTNVTVDSVENGHVAQLAAQPAAVVLYLGEDKSWHPIPVSKGMAQGTRPLPVALGTALSLDAFELSADRARPGSDLAVVLYWHATAPVGKDYTVFAHLVDAQGHMVAGTDGPPRRGTAPTSTWHVGNLMPDGIVIPIDETVPPGVYQLQVGMYDLETMQRLLLVDASGQPAGDQFTIEPITVEK